MAEDRKARAQDALNTIDKDYKKSFTIEYLKQEAVKIDHSSVTLCMVYNATGDTIRFLYPHDWSGTAYGETAPKPQVEISNGAWHSFVHESGTGGSTGAVVYRIQYEPQKYCDVMQAWDTPADLKDPNKVYTEIQELFHFMDEKGNWGTILNTMEKSDFKTFSATGYGYKSVVTGHYGPTPIFEGIITLDGLQVPTSAS